MEKYVRIMAEYSSDGLWNSAGHMIYESEIGGLPATINDRLKNWCSWYDRDNQSYLPESDRKKEFNVEAFGAEGLKIAKEIKKYLGEDWTVVYFDDRLLEESQKIKVMYEV